MLCVCCWILLKSLMRPFERVSIRDRLEENCSQIFPDNTCCPLLLMTVYTRTIISLQHSCWDQKNLCELWCIFQPYHIQTHAKMDIDPNYKCCEKFQARISEALSHKALSHKALFDNQYWNVKQYFGNFRFSYKLCVWKLCPLIAENGQKFVKFALSLNPTVICIWWYENFISIFDVLTKMFRS